MRAMKLILAVSLLTAGMAEADWYWSPKQEVGEPSGHLYTGCNNARCIAGFGGDIHVVYERQQYDNVHELCFHKWAQNLGSSQWEVANTITDPNTNGVYSYSPSIGLWCGDTLMAITNDSVPPPGQDRHWTVRVMSCVSFDRGQTWEQWVDATVDEYNNLVWNPSLAVAESTTASGHMRIAEAGFARTIYNGNTSQARHMVYTAGATPEWFPHEYDLWGNDYGVFGDLCG